jgi:hypothetical protein
MDKDVLSLQQNEDGDISPIFAFDQVPAQPGIFPGLVDEEPTPQAIADVACSALDGLYERWYTGDLKEKEKLSVVETGWLAIYQIERERGRDFRVAALIAWKSWPGEKWPANQQDLAKMLGMKSDRRFYVWRNEDPTIDEEINLIWERMMADQVKEVDSVNLQVAKLADYKATQERRLFYQRRGLLEGETPVRVNINNIQNLSEAELDKLINAGKVLEGKFEVTDDGE